MEALNNEVITIEVLTGSRQGWQIAALVARVQPNQICTHVDGELAIGTHVRLVHDSVFSSVGIVQSTEPISGKGYAVVVRTPNAG